jgi:hypothetical protein
VRSGEDLVESASELAIGHPVLARQPDGEPQGLKSRIRLAVPLRASEPRALLAESLSRPSQAPAGASAAHSGHGRSHATHCSRNESLADSTKQTAHHPGRARRCDPRTEPTWSTGEPRNQAAGCRSRSASRDAKHASVSGATDRCHGGHASPRHPPFTAFFLRGGKLSRAK